MPITEYKVIIGTNAKEIEDAIHADGLTPIGSVDSSFDGSYALQSAGAGTYDIGAVTGYELKQGRTIPELEAQVNACIAGGKQPINGVLSWHDAFLQEMGVVEPISGGGSGGSGGDLPTGNQYEVASFNKSTGAMEAVKMNMNIWTGTDLPRYDAAMSFIPVTNFAAGGLTSTQSMNAVDALPNRGSIALRDFNGRLSAIAAIDPEQVTNLQQVTDLLTTWRKDIEDNIINIINGAIGGSTK